MVQAGYYAIDLHEYGVVKVTSRSYHNNSSFPAYPGHHTFTYTIKTLCRNYGIDYTLLTEDDFIVGYKTLGVWSGPYNGSAGSYIGSESGVPTKSYDATTGKLTVDNIYNMAFTVNASDMSPRYSLFTSDDIICMLVPRSVVVD